jgi:3-phosphoshikimate 1-carboxyvinyltransferase
MPLDLRQTLATERSPWLRGMLDVPGDSRLGQLALAAAALSRGETVISGLPPGPVCAATIRALEALGVPCEVDEPHRVRVLGLGVGGLLEPQGPLDLGPAALSTALLVALTGVHDFDATVIADPVVSSQSHADLFEALRAFGASVEGPDRGRLPVRLRGPAIAMPADLDVSHCTVDAKAALQFAALHARGTSHLAEGPGAPTASTHAERMLRRFGAHIEAVESDNVRRVTVTGLPEMRSSPVVLPADPAFAAFGVAAAAIVPGSEITVERVLLNPARTAVLSALMAMGAGISVRGLARDGEEEVGNLAVTHQPLHGIVLAAHHVAPLVDDLPLLAVAAASAEGTSVFNLPPGLPLLVHARMRALSAALAANGVRNAVTEEAVAIEGYRQVPGGGRVDVDDAGVALSMLILGMSARRRVTLADRSVIEERYPGFVDAFEKIGAGFVSGDG